MSCLSVDGALGTVRVYGTVKAFPGRATKGAVSEIPASIWNLQDDFAGR
jgi:hypothetical protein